jgi:hypothetical protein
MIKMNKKLTKIYNRVYELLKLNLISKVDIKYSKDSNEPSEISTPEIEEKVQKLTEVIKKYFEKVENIEDDVEKKIFDETVKFDEEYMNNSVINEEWMVINLLKK